MISAAYPEATHKRYLPLLAERSLLIPFLEFFYSFFGDLTGDVATGDFAGL